MDEFKYTYSAPSEDEKKEALKIQNQYAPKENNCGDAIVRLKKLDGIVKRPAKIVSSAMGVLGFCCFGFGMSMSLEWQQILWGAILGAAGLVLMTFAYPVYNKIFAKRKLKYAEQIMAISQSVLGQTDDNVRLDIKDTAENEVEAKSIDK